MSGFWTAAMVFAMVFSSALAAMFVRSKLPDHHLTSDSKEVVRLATAMIATLAALVLGLLISSKHASYDQASTQVARVTVDLVILDQVLDEYGPEARTMRVDLRKGVDPLIDAIWQRRSTDGQPRAFHPTKQGSALIDAIGELTPRDARQRNVQARLAKTVTEMAHNRLILFTTPTDTLSTPFLTVLVLWLVVIFGSFGLFAQPNATVIAVLLASAFAVSSAIFLIDEMSDPFGGLMQISSAGLRTALPPL